ncbi:UNVERIFIED_CONTAM: Patellin-4 [Sesamum radiatum]|uniref:Patellin-4 n=1 Tax=Sesamum radiatum TaxID=300843 RepID=A0AAW2T0N7_SESRA
MISRFSRPIKKEVRAAVNKAVALLQDNYPEFAAKNIFINVPFWYVPIQEIPIQYGGIKRENDFEFSVSDGEATEVVIKAGSTQTIEIPTPEKGKKMCSDEAPVRKTFKNQEPGKIVLTVQNCSGKKEAVLSVQGQEGLLLMMCLNYNFLLRGILEILYLIADSL